MLQMRLCRHSWMTTLFQEIENEVSPSMTQTLYNAKINLNSGSIVLPTCDYESGFKVDTSLIDYNEKTLRARGLLLSIALRAFLHNILEMRVLVRLQARESEDCDYKPYETTEDRNHVSLLMSTCSCEQTSRAYCDCLVS